MEVLRSFGFVCGFLGLVACTLGMAITLAIAVRHAAFARAEAKRQERKAKERSELLAAPWWFTEDAATHGLLSDLAHGMSVDEARNRWRRIRARVKEEGKRR